MDAIYEYLKTLGDDSWVARPVQNVSTKNIDPLEVASPRSAAPVRVSQQEPAENPTPANTTPASSTPANKGGSKTKPGKP